MIEAFLDSWELFRATYVAGFAIAVALSVVGIWVVAREQIFLGMAISQASALGIALAIFVGGAASHAGSAGLAGDQLATALAVLASIATAMLSAGRSGRESPEAVTGFVFLLSASVPVLLLSQSPHGLEEIHRLTFSTLLGASDADLPGLLLLAGATLVLVAALHPALLLLALDPEMAQASGLRRGLGSVAVALWLGLCIGLAMRISGMLYTFGCLVLPALVAKNLVRELRPVLWLSPVLALAAAGPGFVLAHHYDTPPAHTTVAILCAALALAWLLRRIRA